MVPRVTTNDPGLANASLRFSSLPGVNSSPFMDEPLRSFSFPIAARQDHRLIFTRDVFAPENPTLARTLTAREPGERVRALVFWDDGLEKALPGFATTVSRWFDAHTGTVTLAA